MKNLTVSDLARAVWRRRFWFLVPLLLGIAGSMLAYQVWPRKYKAFTTVLVEPQRVPADYVKPTVTSNIEDRLHTIEPQILNRDNLERIIRELKLYPEMRHGDAMGDAVGQLRSDLTIQLQGDTF